MQGSLRQFIQNGNALVGSQSSQFAIPTSDSGYNGSGNGEYTIQPTSALPSITGVLTLDGTTQTGFSGTPIIELDGQLAGHEFITGARFTVADITAYCVVEFAGFCALDIPAACAEVARWFAAVAARPSAKA